MALLEKIADMLGGRNGEILRLNRNGIAEIRLRMGRKMRLSLLDGDETEGEPLDERTFLLVIERLMDNSLYSRENELKQGYFTASDGFRVGVCGKVNVEGNGITSFSNISSLCIRVPREVPGCSSVLIQHVRKTKRYSILVVSPPGLGKTTLMRDYIRTLSDEGMNICIADERREIACCMEGIPQLQVGSRTDVLDGCPKALALNMMLRSCAPDMVAVDEIGSMADAEALLEAARCGVAVAATAHGRSLEDVFHRKSIAALVRSGIFDWCVLMGPTRGQIKKILPLFAGADGKVLDVQGDTVGDDTAGVHMCRQNVFECASKEM